MSTGLDSRRERGSVSLFHLKRRGLVEICPSVLPCPSVQDRPLEEQGKKEMIEKSVLGSPKRVFRAGPSDKVNQCRPGFCLQRVSGLGLVLRVRLRRLCSLTAVGPCLSEPQCSHLQNGAIIPTLRCCKNCLRHVDILLAETDLSFIN